MHSLLGKLSFSESNFDQMFFERTTGSYFVFALLERSAFPHTFRIDVIESITLIFMSSYIHMSMYILYKRLYNKGQIPGVIGNICLYHTAWGGQFFIKPTQGPPLFCKTTTAYICTYCCL